MKEKMREFEVSINFNFQSEMTVEFEKEDEAIRFARKHFMDVLKDHLRDSNNLNIQIKESHVITPEERTKLEADHIIEPLKEKKTKKETKKEVQPTPIATVTPVPVKIKMIWINNGTESKRIPITDVAKYPNWRNGIARKQTQDRPTSSDDKK